MGTIEILLYRDRQGHWCARARYGNATRWTRYLSVRSTFESLLMYAVDKLTCLQITQVDRERGVVTVDEVWEDGK